MSPSYSPPASSGVAGALLSGSGSPEGVVTAGPGAVYADTAITLGAAIWTKITGAGNTGWRVTHGDTGWRNLAAYVDVAYMTLGTLYWRRIQERVELSVDGASFATANGNVATALPAPTDPWGARDRVASLRRGNGVFGVLTTTGPGGLSVSGTAVTNGLSATLRWIVDGPWPTVLPGTPA